MKLILMRHTEANWAFNLEDHERDLSDKGQRDAYKLGRWLTAQHHQPTHALISNAKRTQQTFAGLNFKCEAVILPELYLAPPKKLTLATVSIDTECLLVLAHNPGIAELAIEIATPEPTHPQFFDYPSGATLVLSYSHYSPLAPVIDFVTPDDLPE
jgi:phosphohistidine phosphatase